MKNWRNFTILYVKGHSLTKVHSLMKMGYPTDKFTVTIRELNGTDYRYVNVICIISFKIGSVNIVSAFQRHFNKL